MSSIPEELYLDILLRLPVKSLLCCKCVSKSWCSIISDPSFIKSHLKLTIRKKSYNLMLTGIKRKNSPRIICSVSYDKLSSALPKNNMVVGNVIEYDYPFRSLGLDIVLLGCCNGLVCMRVSDSVTKGLLCVWNPCTREYKVIPDSPNEEIEENTHAYAFNYDSTTDDYKLFKIIEQDDGDCLVDVYDLGSNSWRSIEDIPYNFHFHNERKIGVLANGCLHWLGWIRGNIDNRAILSLDTSSERFQKIRLPKEALENNHGFRSFGVLDGCLCVLFEDDSKLYLWVMQEYGVQESWTKRFGIADGRFRDCNFISLIWSFKNDDRVLISVQSDLFLYNTKHERARKISSFRFVGDVQNHFESLVSLNSGAYVGREVANCK